MQEDVARWHPAPPTSTGNGLGKGWRRRRRRREEEERGAGGGGQGGLVAPEEAHPWLAGPRARGVAEAPRARGVSVRLQVRHGGDLGGGGAPGVVKCGRVWIVVADRMLVDIKL